MFEINQLLKSTGGKLIGETKFVSVKGISIDSRTIKPGEAFIAIKGDNFDGHNFIGAAIKNGASCVIVQEKYSDRHATGKIVFIEVKDTIMALGDIAAFRRQKFDIPVIAVTGSSGKTTTKDMIACVLSKKFKVLKTEGTKNNHIGLPLTLTGLEGRHDICVLEIGTNHFGEVENLAGIAKPNIAVITNIGYSHLASFGGLQGVYKEKCSLLRHLKTPDIAVLNADDKKLSRLLYGKNKSLKAIGLGINNPSDFSASCIKLTKGKLEFLVNKKYKFSLDNPGRANVYNALAAIAVARIMGMEYKCIAACLVDFSFPKNRLNLMKLNNAQFINDTYNSNPTSLVQALEVLRNLPARGRRIFVMGDMLELGHNSLLFHNQVGRLAAQICDVFLAVGKLSASSVSAAQANGFDKARIFTCSNSNEARDILFGKISPVKGDVVLVKGSRSMKMEEVFK